MEFLAFLMQSHFGTMSKHYDLINWEVKETLQSDIELSEDEVYYANQRFALHQIPQRYVEKHIQTYTKHTYYNNIKQILLYLMQNKQQQNIKH